MASDRTCSAPLCVASHTRTTTLPGCLVGSPNNPSLQRPTSPVNKREEDDGWISQYLPPACAMLPSSLFRGGRAAAMDSLLNPNEGTIIKAEDELCPEPKRELMVPKQQQQQQQQQRSDPKPANQNQSNRRSGNVGQPRGKGGNH